MIKIEKYTIERKEEWNSFLARSKNGTFLFNRDYMEYHSDRFKDSSLLIYRKNKLYALFPANLKTDVLFSHQGLTYGGIILSSQATLSEVIEIFNIINSYVAELGVKKIVYKTIPYIYHSSPSQEDLYALFKMKDLKLIGRNVSSTIFQNNKIKFSESRKSGLRKAIRNEIKIECSNEFDEFQKILNDNLINKYQTKAVHSLEEIKYLQKKFPDNIKLYAAKLNSQMIGGSIIYITKQAIHTQYISASFEGKTLGALDLLFDFLINEEFSNVPFFDFGQSTEDMGKILNEPLIFQKEGFGGRAVVYDIYEYSL